MTMRLALNSVNLDAGGLGTFDRVHVETRDGRLRARRRSGEVLLDVEATAVRVLPGRKYEADVVVPGEGPLTVRFERAGCGCGGGNRR